ncbi:response regulator transcription factor [Parvibacter caecicola]|uniref:response regulator transcription factor n=1 Tax=Parvibacter caecicola TaxID=747645 RepID=UPI00249A4818|nr:helix-turn-helix transcriptional regulator [Parvibacter caecicola]
MIAQQNTSSEQLPTARGPFDFRLAGLAVQLSWLYLLLYSGGWNPSLSFTRAGGSTDVLYLLSTAALCTVLLMGIWRIKPFMQFARTRPMRLIAPALAMLGTLSYCLINTESLGLAIAGGIFTGVGSAFLWARWAGVFGNVRPREVIGVCPLVVAVAVLVCFSVGYLNPLLQTAAVVLLPGTSGAWLVFAEGTGEAEGGSRTTTVDAASAGSLTTVVPAGTTTASHAGPATAAHASVTPANSPAAPTATTGHSATLTNSAAATTAAAANPRRSPRRHYAPLVVFAAFLGFTTGFLPAFSFSGALMDYDLIFYSGVAVFCLVFVAAAIFADDRRNFPLLFAAPAVVMLCVLLPFSHFASTNPIVAIMEPLGSIAFELFLLIGSVLFARMTDHSPARAYLITRFSMSVFDVLGLACGGLVMGQTTSSVAMQIAAVVMFLITEVFIAVLAFAYFSNRKGTLGNSLQQQAPSNAATLSEPSSPVAEIGGYFRQGPFSGRENMPDPTPVAEIEPYSCHEHTARQESAPDSSPMAELGAYSGYNQMPGLSLAQRCQQLGLKHGLSARELDVLELVAQGRSYARIREDLSISQGTVNYHMSNLYAKLGVHSRQEVIDLVQAPGSNKPGI